jgi:3-oxosteroid 1-dehydrogenase
MASVMGECYPGPGTPIGSCMVFSYLAALDMSAAA